MHLESFDEPDAVPVPMPRDRERSVRASARPTSHPEVADRADPLAAGLEQLVLLIEQLVPDMRGSVLLVDDDRMSIRHGAAPSLPLDYQHAIDGAPIGPAAASCGTAAWRGEQVVVGDIATDPLWVAYRDDALRHDLRACWSTPVFDSTGGVLATFAMYYDRPRVPTVAEQRIINTAAMLAGNIIIRARAEEEAIRANRIKSEFLAIMSHELRTPLTAISGYAMLLLDGIPDPPTEAQRGFLLRMTRAQQHLLGLIEQVLTHAKLEAGRMTYRPTRLRMSDVLEVLETLVGPQLAAKGISYDCSLCDPALVLHCDRQKTVQVLLNLTSNAIKFTPAGGSITVRTIVRAPGWVTIGVRDTGVGMSPEQAARAFLPFVQLESTVSGTERGTGLGLSISRELARGMGGDLTVESSPGAGAEFLLTVPTYRSGAPPQSASPA